MRDDDDDARPAPRRAAATSRGHIALTQPANPASPLPLAPAVLGGIAGDPEDAGGERGAGRDGPGGEAVREAFDPRKFTLYR